MANLRLAMDAAFWDLPLSTPQTLDGTAKAVPGDPAPLDGARASKALRPQQLALLRNGFPLGILPSFSPPPKKQLGSFALQSFLPGPHSPDWWIGLIGQFRPKKLISSIKAEVMACDELDLSAAKDIAKHFFDKSLYALGLFSQVALGDDTSIMFSTEAHGDREKRRVKATLVHNLPNHEITLEAAHPELFLDRNGTYWDVPSSVSLDAASLASDSGFRYRFGLHSNSGHPQAMNSSNGEIPVSLLPGLCTKAAFSYEKTKDFWRERENEDSKEKEDKEPSWLSSYDDRLKEPHSAISGIIGGSCAAWLGGSRDPSASSIANSVQKRSPFSADLFGSLCYTLQHGRFKKDFKDLTRIDARLDISSVSALIKGTANLMSDAFKTPVNREFNPLSSPRLSLILQQQIAGPIVFRVDSRFSFNSPSGIEDVLYGLSYSLRLLESGKVLAWYSPKRKEAMIELRLYEF